MSALPPKADIAALGQFPTSRDLREYCAADIRRLWVGLPFIGRLIRSFE
jgi:hypothetical protein